MKTGLAMVWLGVCLAGVGVAEPGGPRAVPEEAPAGPDAGKERSYFRRLPRERVIERPDAPAEDGIYRVKPGDTLAGIASRFDMTVRDLLAINELANPNLIRPGQVLRVRELEPPPEPGGAAAEEEAAEGRATAGDASPVRTHVIETGDTFSQIALRYGVPIRSLMEANPGLDPARLRPGMEVRLPGSPEAEGPDGRKSGEAGSESAARTKIVRNEGDFVRSLAIPTERPEAKREVRVGEETGSRP